MRPETREPAPFETCRTTLLDLVLRGEVPTEYTVELMLDRINRAPEEDRR